MWTVLDIVLLAVIGAWLAAAVVFLVRSRRRGRSSCSSSGCGGCTGCSGCDARDACEKTPR